MRGNDAGGAALITVLLLPLLLVTLASSLELGALRVVASRARAAADLATVVAIGDQDEETLRLTGRYRPAGDAEDVARSYLAANLEGLQASLGAASTDVAAAADVAVFRDAASRAEGSLMLILVLCYLPALMLLVVVPLVLTLLAGLDLVGP